MPFRDALGRFKKPPKARKPRPRVVIPRKPAKPVRAQPKKPSKAPPKKPRKAPPKVAPRKPAKAPPKKPSKAPPKVAPKPRKAPPKAPPKKPKKPRKKKPAEPPKPPKVWIGQLFGKNRREKIRAITPEDRERIKEAEDAIREAEKQTRRLGLPFGPTEPSPLGYEYYQLIAAVEKMSPHDVYTLFMSPR